MKFVPLAFVFIVLPRWMLKVLYDLDEMSHRHLSKSDGKNPWWRQNVTVKYILELNVCQFLYGTMSTKMCKLNGVKRKTFISEKKTEGVILCIFIIFIHSFMLFASLTFKKQFSEWNNLKKYSNNFDIKNIRELYEWWNGISF